MAAGQAREAQHTQPPGDAEGGGGHPSWQRCGLAGRFLRDGWGEEEWVTASGEYLAEPRALHRTHRRSLTPQFLPGTLTERRDNVTTSVHKHTCARLFSGPFIPDPTRQASRVLTPGERIARGVVTQQNTQP